MQLKKLAVFFLVLAAFIPGARAEVLAVHKTGSGTGWLEKTDQGDVVLRLEGTYYDMGEEQARLLGRDTEMALRSGKNAIRMSYPFIPPSLGIKAIYKYVYLKSAPFMPATFKDEMRGLADTSGIPFETIAALHAATYLTSCSGAAAWGPASADGKLYFIRSNDIAVTIDPETGEAYHDRGMIVVMKPQGEIPYMFFTWPGFIGASDGMNAEGICKTRIDDGKAHSKMTAQRYQDLRGRLVADYGRLDMEEMYKVLRAHYDSIEWEKGPTLGASSHQLAFDPKTGDFLISFSHGNPLKQGRRGVSAFSRPYHRYNLFELLNREPGE